jgi:hypothetical protein
MKLDIPDISHLTRSSGHFMLAKVFMGAGPKGVESSGLAMNFLRLTDLAITEYTSGREASLEFWQSNEEFRLGSALRAAAHFEVCIDALKRAINHLKAMKGSPRVPQDFKDLFPRGLKLLTGEVEGKVTAMRHAIQHLEERIEHGEISEGQSLALLPMSDALELGDIEIRYRDLAEWLAEAHRLAQIVADYQGK